MSTAGTIRHSNSCARSRSSAVTSRVTAVARRGREPWPGRPNEVSRSQYGTFCVTSTATCTWSSTTALTPPSLSTQPTSANSSGRCSTSQPTPKKPPTSSSAVAMKMTSRSSGTPDR